MMWKIVGALKVSVLYIYIDKTDLWFCMNGTNGNGMLIYSRETILLYCGYNFLPYVGDWLL